jgi:hypothetical protein
LGPETSHARLAFQSCVHPLTEKNKQGAYMMIYNAEFFKSAPFHHTPTASPVRERASVFVRLVQVLESEMDLSESDAGPIRQVDLAPDLPATAAFVSFNIMVDTMIASKAAKNTGLPQKNRVFFAKKRPMFFSSFFALFARAMCGAGKGVLGGFCIFNGNVREYFRNFHHFLYRFQKY